MAKDTGMSSIIFILVAGLIFSLGWSSSQIDVTQDKMWFHISHESGVQYVVRSGSVMAFMEPVPGDPRGRNGILLSNGKQLMTTMDLQNFIKFLSDTHGHKVIKVPIK